MILTLRKFVPLAVATLAIFSLTACPKGDVGAPCNHGDIDPPKSEVVTFPALSCNDLICVYADATEPPDVECQADQECNLDGVNRFECINNKCRLTAAYTLDRSMCSIRCESDADCQDGGIGNQVIASGTNCENGFACAAIQAIPGEFCCQKLCICNDDLSTDLVNEVKVACSNPDTCTSPEDQSTPASTTS